MVFLLLLADLITEKRFEISQFDSQISEMGSEMDNQNKRTDGLRSQIQDQEGLIDSLNGQLAELETEKDFSQVSQDNSARALFIEQASVLTQLQTAISKLQAAVDYSNNKVSQESYAGMDTDAFEEDQSTLAEQQEALGELQYRYNTVQAGLGLNESSEGERDVAQALDERNAIEQVASQERSAEAVYEKLQTALKASQDKADQYQKKLVDLKYRKQDLINELDSLTSSENK